MVLNIIEAPNIFEKEICNSIILYFMLWAKKELEHKFDFLCIHLNLHNMLKSFVLCKQKIMQWNYIPFLEEFSTVVKFQSLKSLCSNINVFFLLIRLSAYKTFIYCGGHGIQYLKRHSTRTHFSDEFPGSHSNFRQHMLFYWKSNYRIYSDHSLPPMVNLLFVWIW